MQLLDLPNEILLYISRKSFTPNIRVNRLLRDLNPIEECGLIISPESDYLTEITERIIFAAESSRYLTIRSCTYNLFGILVRIARDKGVKKINLINLISLNRMDFIYIGIMIDIDILIKSGCELIIENINVYSHLYMSCWLDMDNYTPREKIKIKNLNIIYNYNKNILNPIFNKKSKIEWTENLTICIEYSKLSELNKSIEHLKYISDIKKINLKLLGNPDFWEIDDLSRKCFLMQLHPSVSKLMTICHNNV